METTNESTAAMDVLDRPVSAPEFHTVQGAATTQYSGSHLVDSHLPQTIAADMCCTILTFVCYTQCSWCEEIIVSGK